MLQGTGSDENCEIWPQAVPLTVALFFVFAGDQITYAEVKVKWKSDNTNNTSTSTHTSMAIQQEIYIFLIKCYPLCIPFIINYILHVMEELLGARFPEM